MQILKKKADVATLFDSPTKMAETLEGVVAKLNASSNYRTQFTGLYSVKK